jgi:hypothetical protein
LVVVVATERGRTAEARRWVLRVMKAMLGWRVHKSMRWTRRRGDALWWDVEGREGWWVGFTQVKGGRVVLCEREELSLAGFQKG